MLLIRTSRLIIRPFEAADRQTLHRLGHGGPTGAHWLEWTVQNYAALARLNQPPYGDHAITLGGELIGAVGLVPSFGPFEKLPFFRARLRGEPSGRYTPEMGLFWSIDAAHRRQGCATEAAAALTRFAFDTLHVDRLVATTEHANAASIGVMRKLGMIVERNPDQEPAWFQTVGILPHS